MNMVLRTALMCQKTSLTWKALDFSRRKMHAKVVEKSIKNRSKIVQNRLLEPSWGLLRASWKLDHTIIEKSSKFGSLPGRILGPCWPPNFLFYVKNFSKRRPGRAREAIFEVSKNKLNIEGSWDRFSIDFWRVLAPPGKDKMCAPLRRE